MQREIKFRAWDKDEFIMYYSDKKETNGESEIEWKITQNNGIHFEELEFNEWYDPDPEKMHEHIPNQIITEFIGLKDKNNKEIYERDIIKIEHPYRNRKWIGVIIYDKYRFTGDGFCFSHFDNPTDLFSEGTDYIEIIGNIFENPELLDKLNYKKEFQNTLKKGKQNDRYSEIWKMDNRG